MPGTSPGQSATPPAIEISPQLDDARVTILTQQFVVEAAAARCQKALGRPDSYAADIRSTWDRTNRQYLNAVAKYETVLFAQIEREKGKEGLAEENTRLRQHQAQRSETVLGRALADRDVKTVCELFETALAQGRFDFNERNRSFARAEALLRAVGE
jgi:hypothetical protein